VLQACGPARLAPTSLYAAVMPRVTASDASKAGGSTSEATGLTTVGRDLLRSTGPPRSRCRACLIRGRPLLLKPRLCQYGAGSRLSSPAGCGSPACVTAPAQPASVHTRAAIALWGGFTARWGRLAGALRDYASLRVWWGVECYCARRV